MSEWLILHSDFVNPLVLLISGFCIVGCVCRAGLLDKDVYELRWRLTYVFTLVFAGWLGFDAYQGMPSTEKELAALFALLFHLVVSQSKWRNGEPPVYMRKDFALNEREGEK